MPCTKVEFITSCIFTLFFMGLGKCQKAIPDAEQFKFGTIAQHRYDAFGKSLQPEIVNTRKGMVQKYSQLKQGDTISVTFASKINSVCQVKGCWMRLALTDTTEAFIKFKDYGFFVPQDISTHKSVVSGKAFLSELSVAQQKHFAKDAGKSKGEIEAITAPKVSYGFIADGVLIEKR